MNAEILKTIKVLHAGGIILYPTDTLWGLGCDATNAKAVDRIYRIKGRQQGKSLLVLLDTIDRLPDYVRDVPPVAWDLLEQVDTPLTLIYPGGQRLAANLLADDGSIGIRVTREAFCNELIRKFGKPVVSTSANLSGDPAPLSFRQVNPVILDAVDYAVEWNRDLINSTKASSIIKLGLNGEIQLIRE